MDVLVIGNNTIDYVFNLKNTLQSGEKIEAWKLNSYPGGQAVNAAYTMSALGLSVHYVGNFGDDENGKMVRNTLLNAGFCLEGCMVIENCKNHTAVVLVDEEKSERTIVMNKDNRLGIKSQNIQLKWVERVRAVYIDGHELEASLVAAKHAYNIGVPVIADLESIQDMTHELLPFISTLIAPFNVINRAC